MEKKYQFILNNFTNFNINILQWYDGMVQGVFSFKDRNEIESFYYCMLLFADLETSLKGY